MNYRVKRSDWPRKILGYRLFHYRLVGLLLPPLVKKINHFGYILLKMDSYMSTFPQISGVSRFINAKQISRNQLLKQRRSPRLLSFYRFFLEMHS